MTHLHLNYRHMAKYSLSLLLLFALLLSVPAFSGEGVVYVETGTSQQVHLGEDGKLVYAEDEQGNRLPDFSTVGYHSGEKAIPDARVRMTLSPEAGDNTQAIQQALDELGRREPDQDGLRGALLLTRGIYRIEGSLKIQHSGVVLRGEGNGPDGTVLVAAGYGDRKHKRRLITVGDGERVSPKEGSRRAITDDYVPIGTHSFSVKSTAGYQKGDRILVHRPSTAAWITLIGCDQIRAKWTRITDIEWQEGGEKPGFYYQRRGLSNPSYIRKRDDESWDQFKARIPLSEDKKKLDTTRQWQPGSYDFYFERRITSIEENRISIDAPIVQALEAKYGGGAIFHYETPGRVTEVGIENLRLVSEFAEPTPDNPYGNPRETTRSENHAWHGIVLNRNSENIWVRGVVGNYFGWSLVSAKGKRATVQDCVNLGHASKITGGRRYPFMIDGQLNLMQRCLTVEGRHEFVAQARTAGPNAFVDCLGIDSKSSAGPHHRYAVGTLFDNIKSEKYMESRYRGPSGTGHGWAGAQTCFYNCVAPSFHVQAPPGGMSWVIGSGPEPGVRVAPPSLYYQQVKDRLGAKALERLATAEQRKSLGAYDWARGLLD